jgi:transcription elongation factor GreA
MTTTTPTTKPWGKVTYLTERGLDKLQAELDYLRNVRRVEVARRLHEAYDNEDLCENVEFMLAKHEQSWVEGRICELESILTRVEIIKPGSAIGEVTLGSTVTIQEDSFPSETFTIVGTAETNTKEGYISNESPMGCALLGHKVGEDVEIRAPDGPFRARIISVT